NRVRDGAPESLGLAPGQCLLRTPVTEQELLLFVSRLLQVMAVLGGMARPGEDVTHRELPRKGAPELALTMVRAGLPLSRMYPFSLFAHAWVRAKVPPFFAGVVRSVTGEAGAGPTIAR